MSRFPAAQLEAVSQPVKHIIWELAESETRMNSKQDDDSVGWVFWFLWVFASASGLVFGATLDNALTINLNAHIYLDSPLVEGTVGILGGLAVFIGLGVGINQWIILRQKLHKIELWILASIPILLVGQLDYSQAGLTVRGVGVGLAQWLVLRRKFSQAGWWILGSVLGWSVGLSLGNSMAMETGWPLANALCGAVVGAITGVPLVWLLRQQEHEVLDEEVDGDEDQLAPESLQQAG
jgi:hypothetical protein